MPWILTKFIPVFCLSNEKNELWVDYYSLDNNDKDFCPWLACNSSRIDYEMISMLLDSTSTSLCDLLLKAISKGFYISIEIDDFYLSSSMSYKNFSIIHEYLLYGYDADKKIFFSAGHFNHGQFGFSNISFSDIEKGYINESTYRHYNGKQQKPIRFLKFDATGLFDFNIDLVAALLNDYINGVNTQCNFNIYRNIYPHKVIAYGVNRYSFIKKYYASIVNAEELDLRPLYSICDHCRVIYELLCFIKGCKYFVSMKTFIEEYRAICEKAQAALNIAIKCRMSNNITSLVKINALLDNVFNLEVELIKKITTQLR